VEHPVRGNTERSAERIFAKFYTGDFYEGIQLLSRVLPTTSRERVKALLCVHLERSSLNIYWKEKCFLTEVAGRN
jgi:hypothetical protein